MESAADYNLLNRWVKNRDADAFNVLTRRYSRLVYAAALRVLGNSSDAEDVAQSCFETLAISKKPPAGALAPWLHRVATNRALDHLRTARSRTHRERTFAEGQDTHVEIAWDDIYAHVDAAINELPDELRIVLLERFYANRPAEAIARDLGINRRTVYHRSERGIEELRSALRERGIPVATATLALLLEENLSAVALPASLSATLGQLAVAGVAPTAIPAPIAIAVSAGGTIAVKKALVSVVLIVLAAVGLWRVLSPPLPPAAPPENPVALSTFGSSLAGPASFPTGGQTTAPSVAIDEIASADFVQSQQSTQVAASLNPPGSIEGQVVDSQGVGIADVNLYWSTQANTIWPSQWLCQTDAEGRFRSDAIPESAAILKAAHPGHALQEQPIAPLMKFVLETVCVLKGRISANSRPIQDARVSLYTPGKRIASFFSITNPEGDYLLKNIPAGSYTMDVFLENSKIEQTVVLEAGVTSVLDVELELGDVTVQGMLTGVEDPERVLIILDVAAANGLQQYHCRGNSDGSYRMNNIVPGAAQLKAEARRTGAIEQQQIFAFDIAAGGDVAHDIHFSAGGTVSGLVSGLSASRLGSIVALSGDHDLSSIASVEDVQVTMRQADFLTVANVDCNPAGEYAIDGLAPGPYTLIAVSANAEAELEVAQWEWSIAVIQIEEDGQVVVQDFSF